MAHQYIGQLVHESSTKVRDAIFGNVGTMIVFRVGAEDAEFLEKEFQPDFMAADFVGLPKYNFYTKLLIDGVSSRPFSASGIPPYQRDEKIHTDVIIENSRKNFGTPKELVEEKIATEWLSTGSDAAIEKVARKNEQPLSAVLRPKPTGFDSFQNTRSPQYPRKMDSPVRNDRYEDRGKEINLHFNKSVANKPEFSTAKAEPAKITVPNRPEAPLLQRPEPPVVPKLPAGNDELNFKPAVLSDSRPEPEKKKVNINDLRAALEKSLSNFIPDGDDLEDVAEE